MSASQYWHVFAGTLTNPENGEATYTQLVFGAVEVAGVESTSMPYAFGGAEGTLTHMATFDHEPTQAESDALLP